MPDVRHDVYRDSRGCPAPGRAAASARRPREAYTEEPPRRPRDADEERPSRRPRDEEDEREDEDDEERPRRRKKRRRREAAEEAVKFPAIFMMVTGGLGIVVGVINLILLLAGVGFAPRGAGTPAYIVGGILNIIWGAVVTLGGFQLFSLRARTSVIVASIFAFLPCNICCLLGIPAGIWTLVVVSKPDVKESFS